MKKLITLLIAFMLTASINSYANTYEDENGDTRVVVSVIPSENEVYKIEQITVILGEGCNQTSFEGTKDGLFDKDGNNLLNTANCTRSSDNKEYYFNMTNGALTTPGEYTLRFKAVAFSNKQYIQGQGMVTTYSSPAIEKVYTVVAPPLVPGEAVTPAVGSTVMDLSTITIPFDEPVVTQGAASLVTLGGQPVDAVTISEDGLTATITSSATFNEGSVSLSIPKGFFKAKNSSSTTVALSYSWNLVKASLGITAPEFIFKGDVANVTLELTNGIAFAGFQLDMVLPDGLTVEPIAGAESNFVLSRADGHKIMDGTVRNTPGAIRLLSYALDGKVYTGNEGTLVTFKVKAKDNFNGGNIAISNIKFADPEGEKYELTNVVSDEIYSRTYVSSITIAPTALNLETNQEGVTVTATVLPDTASNPTIVWSSSNPEYVTVDENGVVTAVKPTEAENPVYIIATAQDGSNVTAQIPVTVVYTHAATIVVDPNYVNIEAFQTAQLNAVIKDANGANVVTNKTVVWTSSNTDVATVDETGIVTAHIVGEAVITATIQGTDISATATVEVKATLAESVTVSPKNVTLEIGGTYTLTANVDKNATNKNVVWSVESGAEYVSINPETGEVTALAITPEGTPAVVKATTVDGSNKSDTAEVIVLATLATSVEVALVDAENNDTELKHTEFVELKATLTGETTKPIVWTAEPEGYVNIEVDPETGVAKVTANETVGAVKVYATVENTSVRGSIDLNIVKTPVETIAINYDTENQPVEFETGAESFVLTATVGPELATDKTYAWSTTDADIAYVNEENKVVFGQKTGEVTLTATANDNADVDDSLTFNVVYTLAETITISKVNEADDFALKAGETLKLKAVAAPATNKTILWSSDNEAVTVDENGVVTALKYVEGNVTIKAQIFNGETAVRTAEQVITLEVTKGDVNNNAEVNVADVNDVALYIIGQDPVGFIEAAADVNNDGDIDIADIILLVNQIMAQEPATAEQQAVINRARQYADSSNSLFIENFTIAEGETRQIAIMLNNNAAFSAFQADIYLPEGLEFVEATLSDRKADHSLASRVRVDGSVRLLSYSLGVNAFAGSEGELVYMTVKATDNFVGDFQIEIDNIIFVQPNQTTCYLEPTVADVTGYTGVEGVEDDEIVVKVVGNSIVAPEGAEVYDLNGLRVNAENLAKGIYIVKVGNQVVKVII